MIILDMANMRSLARNKQQTDIRR